MFRVDNRSANSTCSSTHRGASDTAKLTNMIVAGFGDKCNLV